MFDKQVEYSTALPGATAVVPIQRAVESNDTPLIPVRNLPGCPKATANFNLVVLRIIEMAGMSRNTEGKTLQSLRFPYQAR